jgi:hypothetical protein
VAQYAIIHDRIAKGKGKAARVVGQIFSVQRLGPNGWVQNIPNTRCILRRYAGRDIEQRVFPSQWFDLVTDVRRLQVGDILEEAPDTRLMQPRWNMDVPDADTRISGVGTIQQYWAPTYMVAQFRPIHKFIGVRLDAWCQVRRPIVNIVDGDAGYQEEGENAEMVLTLIQGTGTHEFVDVRATPAPTPALIPFQLEIALLRGAPPFDLPADWLQGKWHYACPAEWSGFRPSINDAVLAPDGKRYILQAVQESHIGSVIAQGMAKQVES